MRLKTKVSTDATATLSIGAPMVLLLEVLLVVSCVSRGTLALFVLPLCVLLSYPLLVWLHVLHVNNEASKKRCTCRLHVVVTCRMENSSHVLKPN